MNSGLQAPAKQRYFFAQPYLRCCLLCPVGDIFTLFCDLPGKDGGLGIPVLLGVGAGCFQHGLGDTGGDREDTGGE